MTLILVAFFCLAAGIALGMAFALIRLDRFVAAMSNDELKTFGDRVVELRKRKVS